MTIMNYVIGAMAVIGLGTVIRMLWRVIGKAEAYVTKRTTVQYSVITPLWMDDPIDEVY
jgi:hypothetical protein